jgi:hypothetical protein
MSKLDIIGATALSLALAVATPWDSAVAVRCTSAAAGFKEARRYRALMLPIAPSVGRTTTGRPGSIWATMVSGRPCP